MVDISAAHHHGTEVNEDSALDRVLEAVAHRMRIGLLVLLGLLLTLRAAVGSSLPWDLVGGLAVVAAVGALLTWRSPDGVNPRLLAAVELGGDISAALACVLLIDTAQAPLGWLVLAIPVITSGVRYNLVAAALIWLSVTIGSVALEVFFRPVEAAQNSLLLGAQQLAAVGLLALPGTFLVRRLLAEAEYRGLARHQAESDARSLSNLAASAWAMSSADDLSALHDAAVSALADLGFRSAEVWMEDGGVWRPIRQQGPVSLLDEIDALQVAKADQEQQPLRLAPSDGRTTAERLHHRQVGGIAVVPVLKGRLVVRVLDDKPIDDARRQWLRIFGQQAAVNYFNLMRSMRLEQQTRALTYEVNHDGLTGLPNRTYLVGRIRSALESNRPFALLFIDLDGFKSVNDHYGHDAGDEALKVMGARMRDCVRTGDVLGRLSGDEFLAIIFDGAPAVENLAERLVAQVRQPFPWKGQEIRLGASVGVAHRLPDSTIDNLLDRADQAMYSAKRSGGSRLARDA